MDQLPPALPAAARGGVRYAASIALAAATLGGVLLVQRPLGGVFFTIPIAIVTLFALRAGTGPAVLAALLIAVGLAFSYFEPRHSLWVYSTVDRARLLAYLFAAAVTVTIAGAHRASRLREGAAHAATRAAKARVNRLLESIPVAFVAIDSGTRITYLNSAAERMVGSSAGTLLQQPLVSAWPELSGTRLERAICHSLEARQMAHAEDRLLRTGVCLELQACPTGDAGLSVFLRDVTDRRRAEEQVRERDRALETAQRVAGLGSWEVDLRTGAVEISAQMARLLGVYDQPYPRSLRELAAFLESDDISATRRAIETMRKGANVEWEQHLKRPDGTERIVLSRSEPAGEGRAVGTSFDITELRRVEADLHRTEQQLRQIAEHTRDVVFRLRLQPLGFEYVSPAAQAVFGHRAEEYLADHDLSASQLHPEDRPLIESTLKPGFRGGRIETRWRRPDGRWIWVEEELNPVVDAHGNTVALEGIAREVTQRKEAEAQLRRSEAMLRTAQRVARTGSYELNLETGEMSWSEEMYRILGLAPDRDTPTLAAALARVHPEDAPAVARKLDELRFAHGPVDAELRVLQPDGRLRTVVSRGEVVEGRDGRPVHAVGALVDITDLRRTERDLIESERRFRLLAENSRDVVFRIRFHPCRAFEFVSPSAQQLTGFSVEEHYADPDVARRIIAPEDFEAMFATLREPGFHGGRMLMRWRHRDGRRLWVEQEIRVERDAQGEAIAVEGIARDVTERKLAEERLQEADRRKDEFIAVLSHELRNPLSPIKNSLFILARAPPGSESAQRARTTIERQVDHLARLVDDLLDATRIARGKIRLQRTRIDLAEVVRRTAEDHRAQFADAGLDLRLELPTDPVWAEADPTRIAQLVGNLLQNSAKFTPRGGHARVALRSEGAMAVLAVQDDGVGLDAALLPQLFTPFSQADRTLAHSSGGLGLGLALVRGVAELHGGTAEARSDGPGHGAEFIVRLPTLGTQASIGAPP